MHVLRIAHRVRSFHAWKEAFDADPVGREAGGVRSYRVLRLAEDPNDVVVDLEFEAREKADAFAEKLRALWAGAGPRLGLESPTALLLEPVENHTY